MSKSNKDSKETKSEIIDSIMDEVKMKVRQAKKEGRTGVVAEITFGSGRPTVR